jgi:DNA-binding CsgD family transcriptional regulator
MKQASSTLIELTEAVYDLEMEDGAWIPNLLQVGLPILDHGLGVAAAAYTRDPSSSDFIVHQKFAASGPPDLTARIDRAASEWPREVYSALMRPGLISTLSDLTADHPECLEAYARHVDGCRDVFGMTAVDPNGLGVVVVALLTEVTTLKGRERELWQMVGAHVAAGHRLRRAMVTTESSTGLPHEAEAVIDPTRLQLTDAAGLAQNKEAVDALREAAVRIDRARGKTRKSDPAGALEMWKSLTHGRWSLVDWFDSDDRRFVLALPNAPHVTDPRGLSERESLVATYAMHGDSLKLIGYRLGVSKTSVSAALKRVMRKLGVKTRAQLIERFRAFERSP